MRQDDNLEDTVEQPAPEGVAEDESADSTQEVPDPQAEVDRLKAELAQAQAKAEDFEQQVLRALADQDNTRKRAERDVQNAHKYALEKFATELLPVIDSLEMGLAAASDEVDAAKIREGVELTLKMFLDVMKKFGVEPIDPMGESFDPQLHQAMSMQPSSEVPPNTVTAVMQKGYTLNDRLIRPAMVMVSKEA